jgi:hypothetical protein
MAADLDSVIERLERVATWHNGQQKRLVQSIIADLTGIPVTPAAPPFPSAPPAGAAPTLPGEGTGVPGGTPPAPPG